MLIHDSAPLLKGGEKSKRARHILCHGGNKKITAEEVANLQAYVEGLEYSTRATVNGGGSREFLGCLPDNEEIKVVQAIMDNIGFPKLEHELVGLNRKDIVDCIAYANI